MENPQENQHKKFAKPKNCVMNLFAKWILNFFGVGKFPKGQGTLASAVACVVFLPVSSLPTNFQILLIIFLTAFGLLLAHFIPKIWDDKDPSEVVLDEVIGMFIALVGIPKEFWVASFILFRIFDILKVPPVSFFDKIENPVGVMLDDYVAGLMTNILLKVVLYFV